MKLALALAVIGCLLAGCATPNQQINVVSDSFCLAAKKRTWSVDDTPESISEAVKINAGIDKACGVPKSTKIAQAKT